MKYEFEVYQMKVEDHLFWVAKSKALKGCVGQGETSDEAIRELELNEQEWLDTAKEFNIPIPPVSIHSDSTYSGKVSLRFSTFTHEEASKNASALGVSLNQYINDAIVNYNSLIRNSRNTASLVNKNTNSVETEASSVIDFVARKEKSKTISINLSQNLEEM